MKRQKDREALQQERTEREEHVKQSTSAFQPDRLSDGLTFFFFGSHFFASSPTSDFDFFFF